MVSEWTVILVLAISFFLIRGIVRGHRRKNRINPADNSALYADTATAGLLFSDFFSHSGHHGSDFYGSSHTLGGGFGDGGSFGGGDMGGGGGDGGGGGGG